MPSEIPKSGVGLLVIKDHQVLLGRRKASHGAGEYAAIGGHLEPMETFEGAVLRELREEAGTDLQIANLRFGCVFNLRQYAPKHYIGIGMVADWVSGEPRIMEPEATESWGWYDIDALPAPLFAAIPIQIEAYKTGKVYFDG